MPRRKINLRTLLLLLLVPVPAVLIGLQRERLNGWGVRTIDVIANISEAGGFQPDSIQVAAGETVILRFHAQDVKHGVAIGPGLGVELGDIEPGKVREVKLTFDAAGTFTFYCNTWCSPHHWRMRGVIAVNDRAASPPAVQRDPVIDALLAEGVDIDDAVHSAGHPEQTAASVDQGARRPAPAYGAALASQMTIPPAIQDPVWRRTHTPRAAQTMLANVNPTATAADLDDIVAYYWLGAAEPEILAAATTLYTKNCAACHGEMGDGDGFAAGLAPQPPPSFSDPMRMADRRSDVLYAKIRRGGMGTGMPNFGTLFTVEETWALVDYLRTFSSADAGANQSGLQGAPAP